MRLCFPVFFFLLVLAVSRAGGEEPWTRAEALFQAGDFAEGRQILVRAMGAGDLSLEEQARALDAFARFHERDAGDFDQAVRIYKRIEALGLAPGHPLLAAARRNAERIAALDARFADENRLLQSVRVFTEDRAEIQQRIYALKDLVDGRPDYHRIADAWFYLGNFILTLDRPRPRLLYYLEVIARKMRSMTDEEEGKEACQVLHEAGLLLAESSGAHRRRDDRRSATTEGRKGFLVFRAVESANIGILFQGLDLCVRY